MKYANIVFQQESDAYETERILEEQGIESAVKHLAQWDNGEYYDITDNPSHGSNDEVYRVGEYLLSYNKHLPYIGLEKVIED